MSFQWIKRVPFLIAMILNLLRIEVYGDCPTFTKTASGYNHSLFLQSDKTVWASGYNSSGQLGNGTNVTSYTRVKVESLENAVDIAAGYYYSLALLDDGSVWAWGYNNYGQLGNGTITNSNIPVQVDLPDGSVAISIAAGYYHSLALLNDGSVWAWGYNAYGQLGIGTTASKLIPTQIPSFSAKAIAAGLYHSLAIQESDDAVYAWGYNDYGQLGDGTTTSPRTTPTITFGPFIAKAIAGGYYHSLAIQASDDAVYAWGYNAYGQLGDGTTTSRLIPTSTNGPFIAKAIAAGYYHSLAIQASDDAVYAWGYNSDGQLGTGSGNSSIPVATDDTDLTGADQISSINDSSLAIRNSDKTLWGWGSNNYGQLANGNNVVQPIPDAAIIGPVITQIIGGTSVCSGSTTSIQFISNLSDTTYSWTVVQNGVSGASDGTGESIEQTLNATQNVSGTAVYTVFPVSDGCPGPEFVFTVTVNPIPDVQADPSILNICSGEIAEIHLTSNVSNTSFDWTVAQDDVSGAFNGSGSFIQQGLITTENRPGKAVYTIIPEANGCVGEPILVVVNVTPCGEVPVASANPSSETICSGSITDIQLESNLLGTTFSWTAASIGVSGAESGSGSSIQQSLFATGDVPGSVIYTVTPQKDGIVGDPIKVSVKVDLCAPIPPSHFCGKTKKRNGCYYHVLTWDPSPDSSVEAYYLYANRDLVKTIPANGPYQVVIPYNRDANGIVYRLVAVNEFGVQSTSLTLKLHVKSKCADHCRCASR